MGAAAIPIMIATTVAGAGVSAYSAVQAGNARASEANYQAQVARNNATIAEQNRSRAIAAGDVAATTASMKSAAQQGKLKVAQAASGLDVNSGSALDVQESQAETGKLDTLTVMNNAMLKAYGYQTEADSQTAQSQLDVAEGRQAKTAGALSAAGGLLGAASSLTGKWGGGGGGGIQSYDEGTAPSSFDPAQ